MVLRLPLLPKSSAPLRVQAIMDELSPGGHSLPMVLSTVLAAASFASAGTMRTRAPDDRIYDHPVYCLVVSPTATGKTFFLDTLLRDPVNNVIEQYMTNEKREIILLQIAHDSWELRVEGKRKALKKAPSEAIATVLEGELVELMINEPPRLRPLDRMLVTDASCKAVTTEILYEYSYAGWISTEAMAVLSDMRSGDENRLAEIWDGKRLSWVRSSKDVKQIDPHLSLLWMTQNERWQAYQASPRAQRLRGSGAAARMLPAVMPEDAIADKGVIGPATRSFGEFIQQQLYQSMVHSRTNWSQLPIVEFSGDATNCWRTLQSRYEEMKRNDRYKDHVDFVGRMLEHVCRVSSILYALDNNGGEIKLEHVECAEAIIDYYFDVFCALYPKKEQRPRHELDAETLYYWLRRHNKLLDKHRRHVEQELGMSNARMHKAVSELFQLGLVRFDGKGEVGLILKREAPWVGRCLVHLTMEQKHFFRAAKS